MGPEYFALVSLGLLLLLVHRHGRLEIALFVTFVGAFSLQFGILGSSDLDGLYVGIAPPSPRLAVSTLSLVVLAAVGWRYRGESLGRMALAVIPLMLFLVLSITVSWGTDPIVVSGSLHLLAGAAAWICGGILAQLVRIRPDGTSVLVRWILAYVLLQAAVCMLQFVGFPIFDAGGLVVQDAALAGRAGGTLGHPSTVGKALVLLMLLILPLASASEPSVRRKALLALVLTLVPLALSAGRVNAAAALCALVLYAVLDRGQSRWRVRGWVFASLTAAGLLTFGLWARRFAMGEDGTFRQHFSATALRYIEENSLVVGSGPNTYMAAVGPTDPLAAQGWIVHNFFLLAVVELGVVGAAALCLPMVAVMLRAVLTWRTDGPPGDSARAMLCLAPGLVLMMLTGWGMMSGMLIPFLLVIGFVHAQLVASRNVRAMTTNANGFTASSGRQ